MHKTQFRSSFKYKGAITESSYIFIFCVWWINETRHCFYWSVFVSIQTEYGEIRSIIEIRRDVETHYFIMLFIYIFLCQYLQRVLVGFHLILSVVHHLGIGNCVIDKSWNVFIKMWKLHMSFLCISWELMSPGFIL